MKLAVLLGLLVSSTAAAQVIDFEDFAPDGGLVNVNPDEPYMEDGFTLTPSNAESAVFDSAASVMLGNPTDWFGFSGTNIITLTNRSGLTFGLSELLMGPSFGDLTVDVTLVGNLDGGGTVMETFLGLDTATVGIVNWSGLTSVEISASSDAGLDNIVVSIPAPAVFGLLGVAGLMPGRRRRRLTLD